MLSEAPIAKRRDYLVAGAVFLLFLLGIFWRLWTPIDGAARSFGWDAQWEYWGDLQFIVDAIRDGELPLWNPYDRLGYPFHADPQAGLFYPGNWPLVAMALIMGATPYWLIAVKVVLHFWLACMGTFAFLRRRALPLSSAYLGAFVFILSYPFLHNVFSALNWPMAWLPWVLLSIDLFCKHRCYRSAVLLGAVSSMLVLSGAPAAIWYSFLVVFPYLLFSLAQQAEGGSSGEPGLATRLLGDRERNMKLLLGMGVVVALCAVQLLATADLLSETVRDKRDLEFITFSTFGIDDILAFTVPRMLGGNTYLGFSCLLWGAIVLLWRPTPRNLLFAGIAFVGVLLALGHQGDFLALGASSASPFGFFRRAHRYLYVVQFPVAILAAEGLACLAQQSAPDDKQSMARFIKRVATVGVFVFGLGALYQAKPDLQAQPLRDAFILAAVAVAMSAWISVLILRFGGTSIKSLAKSRRLHSLLAIAVILTATDLWFCRNSDIEKRMHPIPVTPRDKKLLALEGVPDQLRIYDRNYFKFRPGIRLGIRDLGGYEDDPLGLARFARYLSSVRGAPRILGHANVGYLAEASNKRLKKSELDKKALSKISKGLWKVDEVAPRVAFYPMSAIQLVDSERDARKLMKTTRAGKLATLERGVIPGARVQEISNLEFAGAEAIAGELIEFSRNSISVSIDAPQAGLVVVNEAWFPHWQASVDGKDTQLFPANAAFRGLFVDAGEHQINMSYQPPRFWALAACFLFGLLFVLAFLLARKRI